MQTGIRHALAIVALVVAVMSGALSLVREYLLFQYPTKFQEPPLFWASLRIAFGISLIYLWHEERQKRLALEKQAEQPPPLSLKQQTLTLSSSILEFVYARKGEEPKNAIASRFMTTDGNEDWVREMQEYSRSAQERTDYERNTLGIYNYKFKRDVVKAIESLKIRGLDCARLETCMANLANENDPVLEGIRIPPTPEIEEAGKQLEYLADQLRGY
jgi:hypothetical protein